jgi:hypothetical protein
VLQSTFEIGEPIGISWSVSVLGDDFIGIFQAGACVTSNDCFIGIFFPGDLAGNFTANGIFDLGSFEVRYITFGNTAITTPFAISCMSGASFANNSKQA